MISPSTPPADPVDLQLLVALKQMIVDLASSDQHYMVSANYYDFLDQSRPHPRRYMAIIYFHQDSAWDLAIDQQELLADVLLSPDKDAPRERIRIPYNQIYQVARNQTGGLFTEEDSVYYKPAIFKMPPLPGRASGGGS